MVSVTMKELLEAGVHFGHQTRRWNPKMKPFIFGSRNGRRFDRFHGQGQRNDGLPVRLGLVEIPYNRFRDVRWNFRTDDGGGAACVLDFSAARSAGYPQRLADGGRLASEEPLPRAVTQDDHVL